MSVLTGVAERQIARKIARLFPRDDRGEEERVSRPGGWLPGIRRAARGRNIRPVYNETIYPV